jgi:predicted acylesterase/phospholipase RssA
MQYDMVFEGGGAKGIVFAGALEAFEAAGHTPRRLIGTSAGAITATALAAGYTGETLRMAMSEKLPNGKPRFTSFMDVPTGFEHELVDRSLTQKILADIDIPYLPDSIEKHVDRILTAALLEVPVFRNIFSFIERGGWFAGEEFLVWFKERLDQDGRNLSHLTLSQFHEQRPDTDLTVIGADTTGNERLILNHRTAPDLPVVYAVRMSMSIPFIWQEVIWQREWGLYRGRDISGHTVVDGGLLSNFAIDLLVSKEPDIQAIMGTENGDINPIGFLIDEKLPVPAAPLPPPKPPSKLDETLSKVDLTQLQTVQRITRLVDTLTGASEIYVINSHRHCVCHLPSQGYGTTEFDMIEERLNALIAIGHKTMSDFLQGKTADTDKADKP